MLNFFKSKLADIQAEVSKFNDRETAEALVAIQCGTAYADGELEQAEKTKLMAPILKQFDQSMLLAKFRELADQCEFDTEIGQDACVKELEDVRRKGASEEKRIAILRMGVMAAKADGEIEQAEVAFLRRAAGALGLSPSQVGL
jgi:tellurite resistance protein TerB